ncbi:MAG: tRNA lysidine(34) synthetase TilS [Phascolarctobacterium sp.]|uniref:tRNA lysidine(34) synthetase TilS n=1 Tax=Phascolarctobacterium sp. TaxID=2049039 RepID=UPI0026DB8524|nr:tRNA lysidine(34) synthetase TilS [Phascolarctobacterium sp.]MDO4920439.1 tRNA lysidine(34) synthetase TilS [Phascolarctobacterium sp.]
MKKIHPLVFRLHRTLQKFLRRDGHYLLAVSGGADSMALACACAVLQSEGWGRYSVCHVEHGLRGQEALEDMAWVQQFCVRRCLPCCVRHVDVLAEATSLHLSVEAAARSLRYGALREVLAQTGAEAIVTAHNSDDQAETVLLRLLRGAGTGGLGGIRHVTSLAIRPFLDFSHEQLMEYCRLQGVAYCHDSSNDDLRYTRNRVRHQLLPLLEQDFNCEVRTALTRTARLLQEDEDFLARAADELYKACLAQDEDAQARLLAEPLIQAESALRKRALRRAYFAVAGRELDYERTEALDKLLLTKRGGSVLQLPGGVQAVYRDKSLAFTNVKIIKQDKIL